MFVVVECCLSNISGLKKNLKRGSGADYVKYFEIAEYLPSICQVFARYKLFHKEKV